VLFIWCNEMFKLCRKRNDIKNEHEECYTMWFWKNRGFFC
jgi:hypothetical protein